MNEPPAGPRRGRLQIAVTVVAVLLLVVGVALSARLGPGSLRAGPQASASATPRILGGAQTPCPCSSLPAVTPRATAKATAKATAGPSSPTDPETGLRWVAVRDLPAQARRTLTVIDAGGPFPYSKDGVAFGNREAILPAQTRGYYREYTVSTPGSSDRRGPTDCHRGPRPGVLLHQRPLRFVPADQEVSPLPADGLFDGSQRSGVYRLVAPAAEIAAALGAAGWSCATLGPVADRAQFYAQLGPRLGFGPTFGANLDALWDALTDLTTPTALVLTEWTRFAAREPEQWQRIFGVLEERTEVAPAFAVVLA